MAAVLTIVGVDPGTTTGIAILDSRGDTVAVTSRRDFSRSDISRYIISRGKPLLIAADVTPAPSLARRLASTFGAELYVPDHDLGQQEKEQLVSDRDTDGLDSHAQDALAAAVRAYRDNSDLLQRARQQAEAEDAIDEPERVVEEAFTGPEPVTEIIDRLTAPADSEAPAEEATRQPDIDWQQRSERQQRRLDRQEKEIERLRDYLDQLEDELEQATAAREELESEQKQQALQDEQVQKWKRKAENRKKQLDQERDRIRNLKNRLERYRRALDFARSGETIFPICENADDLDEQDGPIAFIRQNLRTEPPEQIDAVIVEKDDDADYYEQHGVHAVDYRDLRGLKLDQYYITDEEQVLAQVEEDADRFLDWLEAYRER